MEREQIIKALECCSSSDDVSACESGCPYWCGDYDTCPCIEEPNFIVKNALALINSQEQRIKELAEEVASWKEIAEGYQNQFEDCAEDRAKLAEENEAWQKRLISQEEKAGKAYYDLACEVEDLRSENERLREELEQRPPKLIITKLPKKENENV